MDKVKLIIILSLHYILGLFLQEDLAALRLAALATLKPVSLLNIFCCLFYVFSSKSVYKTAFVISFLILILWKAVILCTCFSFILKLGWRTRLYTCLHI